MRWTRSVRSVILAAFWGLASCHGGGPPSGARDRLAPAAGLEPVSLPAGSRGKRYLAARAALASGDLKKAEREVKLAIQDDPLDARAHFLLACLLEREGESDQAIVGFERAGTLEPGNPQALHNLGTMLLRRGEAVPAARLFEQAVAIRPDYAPSYNNLAKAYYMADLPELAVASYREALRSDPSNRLARKNLDLLVQVADGRDAALPPRRPRATPPPAPAAQPSVISTPSRMLSISPPTAPAPGDPEAEALRELLRDLPLLKVDRRAGRLAVSGSKSGPMEGEMLGRILAKMPEVIDLTTDDAGDPTRMIEIDAVIFELAQGPNTTSVGFDFLNLINLNFNYFTSDNKRTGTGYGAPPALTGPVAGLSQWGWIMSAAANYNVNIANADIRRVALLAQPHLTALSGTQAKFLAGGELLYKVTGLNSGDIKTYPFGTTLDVTPTLLRTPGEDGRPRVHMEVKAGRSSILNILVNLDPAQPTAFDKLSVESEAVLSLGQSLIMSGISLREQRDGREGVPGLMSVPLLKYLFSRATRAETEVSVVILLTPRDPAYWGEQNRKTVTEFVEARRAFIQARREGDEAMRVFHERYPDWEKLPPNHLISQLILARNSEIYRAVTSQDLASDKLDLQLLGPKSE